MPYQVRGHPRIFELWEARAFELLVSADILAEYRRALGYQRTHKRHGYPIERIDAVIQEFVEFATLVQIRQVVSIVTKDPDDNRIIECAIAGGADYIVSGDAHLLNIGQYEGIRILPPTAFLSVINQQV